MKLKKITLPVDLFFFTQLPDLDGKARLELYDKIFAFAFYGKEPEPTDDPTVSAILEGIMGRLRDIRSEECARQKRVENGRNGGLAPCGEGKRRGAPKGNQNARKKPKTTTNE